MFRALQLLLAPGSTWLKIAGAKRGVAWILLVELLPLLLITCAVEGYALMRWGHKPTPYSEVIFHTLNSALRIETAQVLASLALVFGAAQIIRWVGESFHFYPRFGVCFTLAAFGLSPYFILRLLYCYPGLNEWVGPGLGALGCVYVLYQGVGAELEPQQTQGFGLYVLTAFVFTLLCGMHQMLTLMLVQGKLPV